MGLPQATVEGAVSGQRGSHTQRRASGSQRSLVPQPPRHRPPRVTRVRARVASSLGVKPVARGWAVRMIRVDEQQACDRRAPAPLTAARDAGWLWARVINYWGRGLLDPADLLVDGGPDLGAEPGPVLEQLIGVLEEARQLIVELLELGAGLGPTRLAFSHGRPPEPRR